MNIGDLVEDAWGDLAIIMSQVGVINRFVIKYIATGKVTSDWGDRLYPLGRSETQKNLQKKLDN